MVWMSDVSRTQEAFLVGVENGDQRHFGDVEALAQKVDADQHVERAQPQVADDLDALQRVHVGVHVAHLQPLLVAVFGEVFRHTLGQRRHQHAIALFDDLAAFVDEVVHLGFRRAGLSTGGSISPVGRMTCSTKTPPVCCISHLPGVADTKVGLRPHRVPLLEAKRPIVDAGRQAEAELGERGFARKSPGNMPPICGTVTWLSSTNTSALSGRYSNSVGGGSPGRRPVEPARIVLDAVAGARRLDHLDVELRALFKPLRFEKPARRVER